MNMAILASWSLIYSSLLLSVILLSSNNWSIDKVLVHGFSPAFSTLPRRSVRRSGMVIAHQSGRRMRLSVMAKEEGEDEDVIASAFRSISNKVVKEDVKRTNIGLAERGQKFSSLWRRFDGVFPSSSSEPQDLDSSTSNAGIMIATSIFRRDPSANKSVVELLMQTGMTEEDAQRESMSIVESTYSRIDTTISDSNEAELKSLRMDDGSHTFFNVHSTSGLDTFNNLLDHIAEINDRAQIDVRDRWEGDVFISEAFLVEMKGGKIKEEEEQQNVAKGPCARVEKMLTFDGEDDDNFGKDGLVMMVKTTLFQGKEGEPITSEEIYTQSFLDMGGKEIDVLTSPLQRVPGCVANVNVRTKLIPIHDSPGDSSSQHYRVFIDGEADAVLSRGLLSVLQSVLASTEICASHVLDIDPDTVTDKLGLRSVLSKGRNDGLASMMSTIQGQIKNMFSLNATSVGNIKESDSTSDINSSVADDAIENVVANETAKRPTVAMLLSGGVDSSVAMNLLVRQGYDVTAFYLKIWLEDELAHLGQCPWEDDYNVCEEVCKDAGVPLEAISLQREYKERVISYTIGEAQKGRTPNPDIMCNSRVKFGCFYEAISKRDFDYVASGHYAQLETVDTQKRLLRAPDPVKDQSYFLAALTQAQLNRVLFPIGHLEKSRVRELAEEFDLPNKKRPDSQGLCFLGKVRFDEFLAAYLGNEPGDIVDAATGDIIGRHKGIWFHTVGQRKGIGKVLNPKATAKGPWYVVAKDTSRRLIITSNQYDEDKFESTRREFVVEDIKWISGVPPEGVNDDLGTHLRMKIRHGPTIVTGNLRIENADGNGNSDVGKVVLDKKDGGLAPGQFVVFYDGLECLGSAVISERHWIDFLSSGEWMKSPESEEVAH